MKRLLFLVKGALAIIVMASCVGCFSSSNQKELGDGSDPETACDTATCDAGVGGDVGASDGSDGNVERDQNQEPDPSCNNGQKDGKETDVDCGGTCQPCALDKSCKENQDCQTQYCNFGTCKVPSCSDSIKNGKETATDCGGPDCSPCAIGKTCGVPSDCESQNCKNGVCAVPDPACNDGIKNGTETDLDCGGSCPGCPIYKTCIRGEDCLSTYCNDGICTQPTCNDNVQNQGESDVDCGGPCQWKCQYGQKCNGNPDCENNSCIGGICCKYDTCTFQEMCGVWPDGCVGTIDCGGCYYGLNCSYYGGVAYGLCSGCQYLGSPCSTTDNRCCNICDGATGQCTCKAEDEVCASDNDRECCGSGGANWGTCFVPYQASAGICLSRHCEKLWAYVADPSECCTGLAYDDGTYKQCSCTRNTFSCQTNIQCCSYLCDNGVCVAS